MATYGNGLNDALDPGKVNADVYGRFRSKFNRDPNQADLGAFGSANAIDWTKPVSRTSYDSALSWIDQYNPAGGPAAAPAQTPAPTLSVGRMRAPADFVPRSFVAPTQAEIEADSGYAFGRKQVEDSVINSASAAGLVRSPQAREALIQRVGDYASQRAGDVYSRRFNEWREGLGAEERAYATNFGKDAAVTGFNNDATIAEFDPRMQAWDRGEDRTWQRHVYGADTAHRDKVFNANEYWRGRDDYWRDRDEGESRRRFLAQMGLA